MHSSIGEELLVLREARLGIFRRKSLTTIHFAEKNLLVHTVRANPAPTEVSQLIVITMLDLHSVNRFVSRAPGYNN